jgi:Zn-finger nucleic acid-binding protein
VTAHGLKVDVCTLGCGGIWFDRAELERVDGHTESFPDAIIRSVRNAAVVVDRRAERRCPRCVETVLLREYLDDERSIEADECPNCGGHFLDLGELAHLRAVSARDEESAQRWQAWLAQHGEKLKNPAKRKRYTALFEVIFK